MFTKISSIKKILGAKIFYLLLFALFLSIVVSFVEIIGIGFLAVFAVSISDPKIFLDKIPLIDLKNYLSSLENFSLIAVLAIVIFLAFLFKHLITFIIFYFEIKIVKNLSLKIKQKIFKSFLSENYEYYINNNKSELINVVTNQIASFLSYAFTVIQILKEVFLISIIFFVILFVNWKVVLFLTLSLILLTFIFGKIFKKKLYDIGNQSRILEGHEIKHLNESFDSFKFIKLNNKSNFFLDILTNINLKKNRFEIFHFLITKLPKIYLELLTISVFMLVVLYLLFMNQDSSLIFGLITFIALSVIRIMPSFITINNSYANLAFFRAGFEVIFNKIKNLIEYEDINKEKVAESSKEVINNITFQNVRFKYSNSNKINLEDIDFKIHKNDILGIIGASGSGKSTILNLMCGLLAPSNGKILFNDKDIFENPKILINRISYISQDNYLLDDTLKNNIAFAIDTKKIDNNRFWNSIKMSNLENIIKQLPKNENTIIGDKGSKISHGQRQKVGIARALYSDSDILMLDESLNALDYENEKIILTNISKNLENKFLVMVSHRLESLKHCTKLMIIEEGKIKDLGDKSEILNRNKNLRKYFI